MILALLLGHSALAACPESPNFEAFNKAAERGEAAFSAMDLSGLTQAHDEALSIIPCLRSQVSPDQAAAFHRLMALLAFTKGDEPAVLAEFHAARRLEPGYVMAPTVAPPGHPLLRLYAESGNAKEGPLEMPIPPIGGAVFVDGVLGSLRPTGISSILQVYDADNRLQETLYLRAGESMPQWGPLPLDNALRERRHKALGAATAATALTALTFYGLAVNAERQFKDLDDPLSDDELRALRSEGNGYLRTAVGAGVFGVGLGAALVFTW